MRKILELFFLTTLVLSCNNKTEPKLENHIPIQEDTIQYFQNLESEDLVLDFMDFASNAKKVTFSFNYGLDSVKTYTLDSSSFLGNYAQFYFDSIDGKPQKAILIFATYFGELIDGIPQIYDSHASAPAIQYGIYKYKKGKGWYLIKKSDKEFNFFFQNYGEYGHVGEINLVKTGKQNHALIFNHISSGQGYTVHGISIYDLEIKKIIYHNVETISNDGVDEDGYRYEIKAQFVPSNQKRYNLEITTFGTNYLNENNSQIGPYNKKMVYRFEQRKGSYDEIK